MKTLLVALILVVLFFFSFLIFNPPEKNFQSDKINSVIGDISFVTKFGFHPDVNTNENLRIKTHLGYVENLLRNKDVSEMSTELRQKRNHVLNLLHEYNAAGMFPANYDYENRRPCFIDTDGNICAVGYLVEKTSGEDFALRINDKFKYNYIAEMNDNIVNDWIDNSGLTLTECAMIQPNYGYYSNKNEQYDIVSAGFLATNLTMNVLNGVELSNHTDESTIPYIGAITGLLQAVMGVTHYDHREDNHIKTLSLMNFGVGTSTLILSIWNGIDKKKSVDKKTSWNIYSYPEKEKKFNVGLSITHKF